MATLSDIREKYPQYNHLSDKELADALHSKYYSSMPIDDYYKKVGFKDESIQKPSGKPSLEPPLFGHLRSAAGLGLGALQGVAQLGHGLGQLETGGVNKLMALLGHPTHFQAPEPDVFAGPAAQLKGGMPAQIGEAAGQLGGIAALGGGLGGAAKMAGAAPWLAETLGFGTAGAATTPGGAGERAIAGGLGAIAPPLGRAVGAGLKGVGTLREAFKSKKLLDSSATETLKDWLRGAGRGEVQKGEVPSEVLDAVRNNHQMLEEKYSGVRDPKNRKVILKKGLFDEHADLARQRGYVDEPMIHPKKKEPSPIILPEHLKIPEESLEPYLKTGAKSIDPLNSKKLLTKMAKTGLYKDIGLKGLMSDYLKQPSFSNAHELQSFIGKELENYKAGATKFSLTQSKELGEAKEGILKDIQNSMRQNQDSDLHQDYMNLRQGFRNEVAPYRNDAPLLNVIQGNTSKSTIMNTLLSGKPNTNKALADLSPKLKRQLFAGKLHDAAFTRNAEGKLDVKADKLVKAYDSMEEKPAAILKDQKMEGDVDYLRHLLGKAKPAETATIIGKRLRTGALLGAGALAGGYAPYHFLRRMIGE